jgi:NAD(P)-dependent dehydrogenase (short-subunit alcohol dehydrogenase family)
MRLESKVCLITGAAGGIGEEISTVFAREGASIAVCDLKEAEGADLVKKLETGGGKACFVKLDVTDEGSWKKAVGSVLDTFGRLDVLVNNAGISIRMPLEEYPVETWDKMMAVNVKGVFLGMKHSIPAMRKTGGGSIINMSSIAGLIGHKTSALAYIATKGAVTMMTKGSAAHFAHENIRVNSIHPSTVDTPLVENLFQDPEMKKARFDEVPMGRLASVRDVANAALFLASDEASFITGAALTVDGGLTAC